MTGADAGGLRQIQEGAAARAVLPGIFELAEREGILRRMKDLSPFCVEDLCRALHADLGYAVSLGNRGRMIGLLVGLLSECGRLLEDGTKWRWAGDGNDGIADVPGGAAVPAEAPEPPDDGQVPFFRKCIEAAPAYLRGGPPFLSFDGKAARLWESFLGCREFRICRSLLLDFMRIRNAPSFRLLDLCHGPGWGLEAVAGRFPLVRMTALDFTDAFSARARERVGLAGGGSPGSAGPVVTWVGPDRWKGFGHPLPFGDGTFDAVFFSCGDPYIPAAQRGAVYREIARILAPGATLGILTRCRPDADRRHVPSFRIRVSALVHDFAESVCEGWEGFPSAEENIRLFSELGFAGERSVLGSMSLLESSLWVLRKAGADA